MSVLTNAFSPVGNTAWRTLVPKSSLAHVPDVTLGTSWWYGKSGHAYFSGVDSPSDVKPGQEELFEISVRSYHEPDVPGRTVSWGIPSTNERVQARFVVGLNLGLSTDGLTETFSRNTTNAFETL